MYWAHELDLKQHLLQNEQRKGLQYIAKLDLHFLLVRQNIFFLTFEEEPRADTSYLGHDTEQSFDSLIETISV